MTDKEVIVNYRNDVIYLCSLQEQISWNQNHRLPIFDLPEKIVQIRKRLLAFETILDNIADIRTRNIARCRYALGMDNNMISCFMEMSIGHVGRILLRIMNETEHRRTLPEECS